MTISLRSLGRALSVAASLTLAPVAFAADGNTLNLEPIKGLAADIMSILDMIVPVIFAIAFIVFIWGVFKYFVQGGANEESRSEGAKFVMYAVIGLAVMLSVWGLVHIVVDTFGFKSSTRPCLPTFSGPCKEGTP